MSAVYFTLVAIALYFISDRILDQIERIAGRRFENRSIVFFAILLALALISFHFINTYTGKP